MSKRPPAYLMEPRPRPATPPPVLPDVCEVCGRSAPVLIYVHPDTRWRCIPCADRRPQ